MNRYSLVLIVLILSLLSMSNCVGDVASLRYKISYGAEDGGFYKEITVVGAEGASKDFDDEYMWSSLPSHGILLAIRKVNGVDEWNGDTGWYAGDVREPLAPGQSITVDGIYLWAVPGTPSQDMHLRLSPFVYLEPGVSFSLSLVSIPQGVEYTGPTTWGPETTEITLPFYSTDNGENGYEFQMSIYAVPEPSPLIALAGLSLLTGGALVRKRKRAE